MSRKSVPGSLPQIEIGDTRGLPPAALAHVHAARRALTRGAWKDAERAITASLVYAPQHAEPNRLLGIVLQRLGRPAEAIESFGEALKARPDDAGILALMAQAQADANDVAGAIATLRVAAERDRQNAHAIHLLAGMLERHGEIEEALGVLERVLALDSRHSQARLGYARCLFFAGRESEALAQFRELLSTGREVASAWYGIAEMKTVKFDAADLAALKALCAKPPVQGLELAALHHALGKALEDAGDFPAAFGAFNAAAKLERARFPWNADAFDQLVASVRAIFPRSIELGDEMRGSEVIFIVGMPRSGSTLVEQILAAHPHVEGGSELPDLDLVVREESARRHLPFAHWMSSATPDDWRRLGENYLARTARWRERKPRFTDKFPGNWVVAEAVLAMLPGARIIDARRDPLEMCWSCFKQFFAPGLAPWSSDFRDLVRFWRECRDHGNRLVERYPDNVRIQHYEHLLDDPSRQTRELLAFCGLPFDQACERFYLASRTIRTASAAQVRRPIQRSTGSTAAYGALLDPLRQLLNESSAA